MTKIGSSLCLLSLLAVTMCQGHENLLDLQREPFPQPTVAPSDNNPQIRVPLDRFMLNADDDIAFGFGFEVLELLRTIRTNCEIKRRQEELEFNTEVAHMMRYYRQTEHLVANKDFTELSHTNREAIQKNFEDAFIVVETARNDRLKDIQAECDENMDAILTAKKQEALSFVRLLIQYNPTQFTEIMFQIAGYRQQIRQGLIECMDYYITLESAPNNQGIGDPFDLCYGTEIGILADFIAMFLAEAESISRAYYGTDDEDYNMGESGGYNFDHKATAMPTPVIDDIFLNDIIPKPENGKPENGNEEIVRLPDPTEPVRPETVPVPSDPTESKDGPTTITTPTSQPTTEAKLTEAPEEKQTNEEPTSTATPTTKDDKENEILHIFVDSLEPGPVILENMGTDSPPSIVLTDPSEGDESAKDVTHHTTEASKPTEEYPEWARDSFKDVIEQVKKEEDKEASQDGSRADESSDSSDSSNNRPGGSKSTKSHDDDSDDEGDDGFEGAIEIDIPGVGDVEVGVETDGDGVSINAAFNGDDDDSDGVIIDPIGKQEDQDSSFVGYFFTYFFVTVGVLVILAVIMLTLGVAISRRRNKSNGYSKLLTEDEKITVMKQSGYVNPTYKFFDQATSI